VLDDTAPEGATAADGLAALEVIEAIERSVATGSPADVGG
jgi:predicted dehydrogenase